MGAADDKLKKLEEAPEGVEDRGSEGLDDRTGAAVFDTGRSGVGKRNGISQEQPDGRAGHGRRQQAADGKQAHAPSSQPHSLQV